MNKILIAAVMALTIATYTMAAERKPLKDVDTDAFTNDTQITLRGAGDNHMAFAWWIPNEFWQTLFSRDASISEADKKAVLQALSGISLLAIVQADITELGAFKFYSKEAIEKNMVLSFSNADGKKQRLSPAQKIDPNLEVVLGTFKPILGAAMGNFGNNLHFYVLNDTSQSSHRLLDPYQDGVINIQLERGDGVLMDASIETPINALFVPRKCPNGKEAHISWKFCPWNGEPLQ